MSLQKNVLEVILSSPRTVFNVQSSYAANNDERAYYTSPILIISHPQNWIIILCNCVP